MVEQNSIAPQHSPGYGTQTHSTALSLLRGLTLGFVCHVSPHLLHCQFEQSWAELCAPGTFSLFRRQKLRLFLLFNVTLFCSRGEKQERDVLFI